MRLRHACGLVVAAGAVAFVATSGCAKTPAPASPGPPPGLGSPFTGYASAHYKDPRSWLCLPGRDDACAANLDATELLPDGARVVVRDSPTPSKGADKVDCFYVYPTVDLSLAPANHTSFADLGPMTRTTIAQAARFRTTCRLFAPLYRQATIGSYLRAPDVREGYLAVAASDVMDAFAHYLATYNEGRKIVLIGHSQGAEMVSRLLKRYFDDDPAMRERLLLALPIGGHIEVPTGETTGGTFAHIPVCTGKGETGCVVGYHSFIAGTNIEPGFDPPTAGRESVCVDPVALDGHAGQPYSRAFIFNDTRFSMASVEGVTTPFVMLRDFYRGTCTKGPGGADYAAVSTAPGPNDVRESPVNMSSRWFRGKLGLHIFDFQFAQGDLVDLVARRAAALP